MQRVHFRSQEYLSPYAQRLRLEERRARKRLIKDIGQAACEFAGITIIFLILSSFLLLL